MISSSDCTGVVVVSREEALCLRREARAMAGFRHPHLAAIHGLETWRGRPMLVVEYLAGGKGDMSLIYPVDPKQLPTELDGVQWPPQT